MRRTGILGLICVLVLAGLSGCSAATEGLVGVRLGTEGELVGVFHWCQGKAGTEKITLYLGRDDGGVTDEVVRLERDPDHGAKTAEDVALLRPAGEWQTKLAPPELDDEQIYHLRAWNKDGGAVRDFPFRISELRGGTGTGTDVILTKRWEGKERGYVATFRTPEDFASYADAVCDDAR